MTLADITEQFRLDGKVALVTGAGKGIGKGIALAFAKAGADVALVARTKDDVEAVAGEIRAMGRNATAIPADVTDIEGLEDIVGQAVRSLGGLDILVNNAGGPYAGGKDEWDPDGYVGSVAVNMSAHMRLTMACHDRLKASAAPGGASVVSIVSMSAFVSAVQVPAYSSSKAGLVAFTKNLARRWVDDGIRVNAVAPGLIDTRMTHPVLDIPEMLEPEMRHTPMNRMGTPDEVAAAALFLSSSAASYVTGATYAVDGGYLTV